MATEKQIARFRRRLDVTMGRVCTLAAESRRLFGDGNRVDEFVGNAGCELCEAEAALDDTIAAALEA